MSTRRKYTDSMVCQECRMTVAPATAFHPHLHCVIWKAYHRDPNEILQMTGYARVPVNA